MVAIYKKWIYIVIIVICVVGMIVFFAIKKGESMDFNKITKGLSQLAVDIKDENGQPARAEEYSDLLDKRYKRYYGKRGYTAQRSWLFFDESGNLLFTLTDLGNRRLIQISIDGNSTLYQIDEEMST